MKKCYKCQEEKNESEFHKNKNIKDGLNTICKECKKEYSKLDYQKNKEKIDKRHYEYNDKNKEKIKEYRQQTKEHKKTYDKQYYEQNKEKIKEKKKEYTASPQNKEKINQQRKKRYQTNYYYKIRQIFSSTIRKGLKENYGSKYGSSILNKLPHTMKEYKKHIESLWEPWMNWENHGNYDPNRKTWQIDHIIPHSFFHYTDMDCQEFKDCWALSNLRPLDSLENIKKSNKLI